MARISAPKTSLPALKRLSVRIPVGMHDLIEQDLLKLGFNKKQRTPYYEQVIKTLLDNQQHTSLIAEEFIEPGTTKVLTMTLNTELTEQIDIAVKRILAVEGIKKDRSALIRTALVQRLMASAGIQLQGQ